MKVGDRITYTTSLGDYYVCKVLELGTGRDIGFTLIGGGGLDWTFWVDTTKLILITESKVTDVLI